MAETTQITKLAPKILSQKDRYTPLSVGYEDIFEESTRRLGLNIDGLTTISLYDNQARFFTELVPTTAPKGIQSKLGLLSSYGQQLRQKKIFEKAKRIFEIDKQINFLLIVPYVTSEIKDLIQNLPDVSVMDLCGNYIIKSKNISAVRLDQPNEYRESRAIQKIYQGVSALVGRALLEGQRKYESVTAFVEEIGRLGGSVTFPTVSKVLSSLESDLIIERAGRGVKLIQPDKLLQKLLENFSEPKTDAEIRLKIDGGINAIKTLCSKSFDTNWVLGGESSVQKYAIATTPQIYKIYTSTDLPELPNQDSRFFNVVIQKTSEPSPFFARKLEEGCYWAGLLQTYLELMISDKRGKELAEPLRDIILKGAT